jgi:hypothetical protein
VKAGAKIESEHEEEKIEETSPLCLRTKGYALAHAGAVVKPVGTGYTAAATVERRRCGLKVGGAVAVLKPVGYCRFGLGVGGQKMHIFTTNIPTFHARYGRYVPITNEFHEFC